MDLSRWTDEVEEISQQYAARFGVERTSPWFLLKLQEEVGELTQAYLQATGQGRDKGRSAPELRQDLEAEVADVMAMLLLFARHHEVDVEDALQRKWMAYRAVNAPHLPVSAPHLPVSAPHLAGDVPHLAGDAQA